MSVYKTGMFESAEVFDGQVFGLLALGRIGDVALPDVTPILPYLGLFSIVVLRPRDTAGCSILTPHLPALSILQNNQFVPAPDGTSPADQNAARIIDVQAITTDPPESLGMIPLSPTAAEFAHRRYWRLPVNTGGVLATLIPRLAEDVFDDKAVLVTIDP